jgi:hypothetical protein
MKTRLGVIIFVFLTGMILWGAEPALLYGCETPEGNVWDQFIDPKPYPGVHLEGPLSIYYDLSYNPDGPCGESDYEATMYYTVRLNKVKAADKKNVQFYTFQGKTEGLCLLNDTDMQGAAVKDFLGTVVVPGIFETYKSWKLKSIDNVGYNQDDVSSAFVADIEIVVDKK